MPAGTRPHASGPRTTGHGQRPAAHAHGTAHHAPRPAASWARQLRTGHGPRPGPMVRDYRPATHGPRSASGTFTHHGARAMGPGLPGVPARYKANAYTLFILATDNVRARTQASGPVLSAKKNPATRAGSAGPAGPAQGGGQTSSRIFPASVSKSTRSAVH